MIGTAYGGRSVQADAKKLSTIALLSKTPRKQALLNIHLRALTIRIHPISPAVMRVSGVLLGQLIKLFDFFTMKIIVLF